MFFKVTAFTSLIAVASAHMGITSLCPGGPGTVCPSSNIPNDPNLKTPISGDNIINAPICGRKVYATGSKTWKAGENIHFEFTRDGAAHGGGHCQFGVSYDGGETFVVIHTELKYCFTKGASTDNTPYVTSYDFPLPSDLPSGDAIIGWNWVNAIGHRELYMNCADVTIEGTSGSFTGPKMVFPNYGAGTPQIPEFGGQYDTGLGIYNDTPDITVGNGNGSSPPPYSYNPPVEQGSGQQDSSGDVNIPPAEITTTPAYNEPVPPPTVSLPPKCHPPAATTPTPPIDPRICTTEGEKKCDGTANFKTCNNGFWETVNCPQNSSCITDGNGVKCNIPGALPVA